MGWVKDELWLNPRGRLFTVDMESWPFPKKHFPENQTEAESIFFLIRLYSKNIDSASV